MYAFIRNIVRNKRIRKYASNIETGFIPLSEINSINVIINVEEPGFDELKDDILSWGKTIGKKINIYFFDFRKLGKDELLLTSIANTIIKRELDWTGMPDFAKICPLVEEKSDLLISMIDNHDYPIDFLARCTKARFKIGRHAYEGHPYNMTIVSREAEELRSEARQIFSAITEFITKIK